MTPPRSTARGFMLVELMVVVMAAVMLTGVLFVLVNEAMYVQRTAAARADRMSVIDNVTRTLRRDVLAAARYRWETDVLQLNTLTREGPHVVRYIVNAEQVVRLEDGVETHVWRAARLEFGMRREPGRAADILWIEFNEQPPPRALEPAARRSSLPLVLPPPEGGRS